jgi:plastocyanin
MARWLKTSLRILALTSIVAAAAPLLAACGGGSSSASATTAIGTPRGAAATPTKGAVVEVQISDNQFTPADLTIKVGTTVRWVWSGSNQHSVLLNGVDSGKHQGSGTFEQTFSDAAGTYNYQCGVHGAAMAGKIIVQ